MEFRFLGDSGLKVSAISYGNWVTHTEGKAEQATACVRAALEVGITTFDTAEDDHGQEIDRAADDSARVVRDARYSDRNAVWVATPRRRTGRVSDRPSRPLPPRGS